MKNFLIAAILIFSSSSANAIDCTSFGKNIDNPISDEVATQAAQIARQQLPQAILSDGSHPAKETEQEQAKLLIPLPDIHKVLDTGVLSAHAEACGFDADKTYLNMMKNFRQTKTYTDKQLAFIGLLHGRSMQAYSVGMSESGGCRPQDKAVTPEFINKCIK